VFAVCQFVCTGAVNFLRRPDRGCQFIRFSLQEIILAVRINSSNRSFAGMLVQSSSAQFSWFSTIAILGIRGEN
jgi:hypothetical protein